MSLLLEALKRAEEDSKKRKLAAAAVEALVVQPAFAHSSVRLSFSEEEASESTLALLEINPAQEDESSPAPAPEEDTALGMVDFVDINLDLPESHATLAQPIAPTFRAAPAALPRGVTPAKSAASPRQAKSAANVMAGKPAAKNRLTPQKRKALLAIAAVLIALPVVAFLLFGDRLLGSSGSLLATSRPPPLPPSTAPAAPALSAETPAPIPAPASAVASLQSATASAPVTLAAPPPPLAVPARKSAVATQQTATNSPPAPRSRTAASPRAVQGDGAAKSTVIDLDRPASNARAASPQQQAATRPPTAMESAYAAYQSGNTQEAARLYRDVLKQDPTQRDAWLGLAVIAHNNNQREPAMDAYKRVLRLEPQNATALAGLTSLNNNAEEPRQESRLRELLARSPQEADLNHSLALVLSGERRWSEAQQLFFKAHTLAPQEPQFAYNLAVTLDQLRKSALAAQYYETALDLAQGKAASFDEARARTRLAALRAASAANPDTKTP
jgi:Tfp pilus assembly protein PilF